MSSFKLELPTLQNWSCHTCSGCCRQHEIEITPAERERIDAQGWTTADGLPDDRPPYEWFAGPFWRKRYRLRHRDDGACVFLNEKGLCRIHAKFGEPAKPLPCQIYPYAFHPSGKKLAVGLRFSCPSVARNQGRTLQAQLPDLRRLASAVVPDQALNLPAPAVSDRARLDWGDVQHLVDVLKKTLVDAREPLMLRWMRTWYWTEVISQADLSQFSGPRLKELTDLIVQSGRTEFPKVPDLPPPSKLGHVQFRQLVAQYARTDTVAGSGGLAGRWRLLQGILAFTRGTGLAQPMAEGWTALPFEEIERPTPWLTPAADELFTRYFRVKVESLAFCGRAYYDEPFTAGAWSLLLMLPVTLYLARWHVRGRGGERIEHDDLIAALTQADHLHGYSPALGQRPSKKRVRFLARTHDLSKLGLWYAREV